MKEINYWRNYRSYSLTILFWISIYLGSRKKSHNIWDLSVAVAFSVPLRQKAIFDLDNETDPDHEHNGKRETLNGEPPNKKAQG
jgi:hypothetical protein